MLLPENKTGPPFIKMSLGIVQIKSEILYTSIYPPTLSTLKLLPSTLSLSTDIGPKTILVDTGFL